MGGFLAHLDQTGMLFALWLFSCCSAFLSGLCLLLYFKSRSLQNELWQELGDLRRRIESLPAGNTQPASPSSKTSFDKAELQSLFVVNVPREPKSSKTSFDKAELQSRLENLSAQEKQVPGKYRHVASLERSGLGPQEIAEILDVSPQEAKQMLSLVRGAQKSKSQIPD